MSESLSDSEGVMRIMDRFGLSKSELADVWKRHLKDHGAEIEVTREGDFNFEKYTLPNGRVNVFVTLAED